MQVNVNKLVKAFKRPIVLTQLLSHEIIMDLFPTGGRLETLKGIIVG